VRNPLRSEAEAFRFLLGTIGYFAAIVAAARFGGRWVGLGVFLVLTALAIRWFTRPRRDAG
jgi:Flp pilus assembly protein TadB